ncbi:hypothetical protein BCR43DRAFT_532740 [Syncephalastrum racemosum]|uniref:37S ribosomal protein mrp10, mitochondrial n=1 Tax=Syncephalastrum racemosum TaxID=13706 RepID=A0A1X2H0L9_SYNRA|nr:hypothetical protein BCR43DRAFT_532740 [Syncephalastrum racemosum]
MKLKQLKVRPKKLMQSSPCLVEMGALFECWATAGIDDRKCTATAKTLQECMAQPARKHKQQNTINYHLARLSKHL